MEPAARNGPEVAQNGRMGRLISPLNVQYSDNDGIHPCDILVR
jgi:hypothetical protein